VFVEEGIWWEAKRGEQRKGAESRAELTNFLNNITINYNLWIDKLKTSIFRFELEFPFELLRIPLVITEILSIILLWIATLIVGIVVGMIGVSLEIL
jgi:hypothetical protein